MEREWFPQEFPIYYGGDAPFRDGVVESGARGAEARIPIQLNNAPTLLLGVRVTFSWEPIVLPPTLIGTPDVIYQDEQYQRLDEECSIEVQFTQQNVTAGTGVHHLRNLQGSRGINYHPLPAPFLARGGNTVTVSLRRLQSYPEFVNPETEEVLRILPRAYVTLVAVSLVDDLVPQAGPPSTMDLARWMQTRMGAG